MKKFISNVSLLLVVSVLLGLLVGCNKATTETPTEPAKELTGCTVEVKSAGGKALEGVGVYVYADATKADMIDFSRTDANGIATISHSVPEGGVAVLDKVPDGYVAKESYAITTTETKITLEEQLREQISAISLGDVMFDFTVTDVNGVSHTLSQLLQTKKAVVLNLWFVNCNPCKAEFPYLVEAYGKYSDDLEVLAINPEGDSESAIADFVTQYGLTFPTARGEEAWKGILSNLAYPTTIIIDRFGTVGLIHTGGVDSAKVFEGAFAYFTADDYVQSTVKDITELALPEDTVDPTEPTEPEATTAATAAPTVAPTVAPTQAPTAAATTAATKAPTVAPTQAPTVKPTQAPTAAATAKPTEAPTEAAGPDGTLVNPEEPVEQYGFTDFSIEVGAGEKMLVYMIRTMNKATFCIADKDAYVIYKGKTYTPTNGTISIEMESEGSFSPLQLEIGNSGSTKKTFNVTFAFDPGTTENPITLKTGTNTITTKKGDEKGVYYTFKATKDGTLTSQVKSVDPNKYNCGITINDKQEIPTVISLEDGNDTITIELPAGAEAEIVFSAIDPNKEWNHPATTLPVEVTFK